MPRPSSALSVVFFCRIVVAEFSVAHRQAFRAGVLAMFIPSLWIGLWVCVTGVAMVQSVLSVAQAITMSLIVYAGSAQLAALPLIVAGAPFVSVILTALLVNMRFALASALLVQDFRSLPLRRRIPLGTLTVESALAAFLDQGREGRDAAGREHYLRGAGVTLWLVWQVASIVGILGAGVLPISDAWSWIAQMAILALIAPMLRARGSILGLCTAAALAAMTVHWPVGLGLLTATVLGALVAMLRQLGHRP
jgi:hypothetical protein